VGRLAQKCNKHLKLIYNIQPDSDHVAKFQGDRSRDLGERVAKQKNITGKTEARPVYYIISTPRYLYSPSTYHIQWRRQTVKSGSAFKGQLYFQVGQMEGPNVTSEAREARSAKGVWGGAS